MVEYWHWHSIHYGQETYWKGILGHDLEPNRIYHEFTAVAKELKNIGSKLVNLKKKNDVAILYSHDSYYGLRFMPYTHGDNYPVEMLHSSLYNMNIETDIVHCDKVSDFSEYKMLIIPPLYIATDELLEKIDAFVKNGGKVIMMYKSGYCNEHSAVRAMLAPGPLRKACGFYYQESSTIGWMELKDNPFGLDNKKAIGEIIEFIIPETAQPLAYADHPFFGKWPVITENSYGKGSLVYIASYPSQELFEKIVRTEAEKAGIVSDDEYKFPIIVKKGTNDKGRTIRYIFNYSPTSQEVEYNYASKGKELLKNRTLSKGDSMTIAPWDLLIVEE